MQENLIRQGTALVLPRMGMTIPIPFTVAARGGKNSHGVQIGVIPNTDPDVFLINVAGTITDETTDAIDAGASDVILFPGNAAATAVGDYWMMGSLTKFSGMVLVIGQAGVVGGGTLADIDCAYSNAAGGFTDFASSVLLDSSTTLTAGASTFAITFDPPSDWAPIVLNGNQPMYYAGMYCDGVDVYQTTDPLLTRAWVMNTDSGKGISTPWNATLRECVMLASTNSATNNDTILLIINVTTGHTQRVTWTGGDPADSVVGLTLHVNAGDQLAVQVLQEDGTTEFANGNLQLLFDLDR